LTEAPRTIAAISEHHVAQQIELVQVRRQHELAASPARDERERTCGERARDRERPRRRPCDRA
jgi:hypothetical protein